VRLRVVLATFVSLAVLSGLGIYLLVEHLTGGLPIRLTQECVVTAGGTATLEPEQMANAATIAAVGIRRKIPTQGIVIALATAMQESKLQNLGGGDRDSIGLFQQRPSMGWGSEEQISDPRYATGKFYDALLKVKNWQQKRVTDAAQAVQKSAYGEAYERWADDARIVATALIGDATSAVGCTITGDPAQRGIAAASALLELMTADWGQVTTVPDSGVVGLSLAVDGARTGWQYAHWLVSHAGNQGIHSVRYADQIWTARAASWTRADTPAIDHVVAEVYS
jgi:hypothetical protein